ncbi:MAG: hypothetical protein RIS76_985 [Verrucomicrobiota bacterium]|jgi:hypothetical protein
MTPPELESILRAAPQPPAPAGLHERLASQARQRPAPGTPGRRLTDGGWLQRWWPTLLIGGGIVACAATLITRQDERREQHARLETVRAVQIAPVANPTPESDSVSTQSGASGDDRRVEILRLRAERAELRAASAAAAQIAAETRQLQDQIAAQYGLDPEQLAAMDQARDRARSIACINNLKNIGLALRTWAIAHQGAFPMDLLSMTDELRSPKTLVCPADTRQPPPSDWSTFKAARITYDYLSPGGSETDPTCVAARCPIHRNLLLSDGSAHMSQGDGTNLTPRLENRDGKLYLK